MTSSLDTIDMLKATEASCDVSEDDHEVDTQQETYLQSLIVSREVLVAKKEALRKFSAHTPKANQAMHIIQQQIEELTEKIRQAPMLYDEDLSRSQARW